MSAIAGARPGSSNATRWIQLILGIICMASVANLQYGWTLFVLPIQNQWGWSKAEIQVAFTIFILLETWLVPFEGAIVDRIGPRWMILAGGVCTFLAWFINSRASSLGMLYLGGAVAGSPAARFTEPVSATRSNGFPTGADCAAG
jgi:MFS transporter, OFA family, oxalate/formate antiporter